MRQLSLYKKSKKKANNGTDALALSKGIEPCLAMISSSQDIIYAAGADGKMIYISPKAKDYGYDPKKIIGRHIIEFAHPEDRERVAMAFAKAVKTGKTLPIISYRILKKDGSFFYAEQKSGIVKRKGKPVLITGVIRDVTAKQWAETAIKESEEKYRTLVETTDTGYLILDAKGRVMDANAEYVRLTGHKKLSEITGRSVIDWTAKHHRKKNAEAVAQCARDGFIRNLRVDYVNKKGQITPVEINATVAGKGESARIISLCRDITERELAEEALRKGEEKYRLLVEGTNDIVYSTDNKGSITYVSPQVAKYGWKPEELIGKSLLLAVAPEDREKVSAEYRKSMMKGLETILVFKANTKSGKTVWFSDHGKVQRDEKGLIIGARGVLVDITERKLAEEALAASERKYRMLVEGTSDIIFSASKTGTITYVSPQVSRYGWKPEELTGKNILKVIYAPDRPAVIKEYFGAIRQGSDTRLEFRALDKSGRIFWFSHHGKPQSDELGKITGITGTLSDITQKKLAEEALKKSEESYRTLIDSSFDMIYVIGKDDTIKFANPQALRALRAKSMSEMIGKPRAAFFPPEIAARQKKSLEIVFRTGKPLYREVGMPNKGTIQYQETQLVPLKSSEGKTYAVLGISRDITERKRAEKLLSASEQKYRLLFEGSRDALMTLTGPKWKFTHANSETLKMFGFRREEDFLKMSPWEISPKYQPDGSLSSSKAKKMLKLAARDGSNLFEWEHKRPGGETFTAEVLLTRIRTEDGILMILGCVRDVTLRKKTERELYENQALLRMIFEIGSDLLFIKDLKGRYIKVNKTFCDLAGRKPRDIIGRTDRELVDSKTAEIFKREDLQVLLAGKPMSFVNELNVRGKRLVLNTVKTPFSKGEKMWLFNVARDITRLKKMEEELAMAKAAASLNQITDPLTHGVNNALAVINGYATLLQDACSGRVGAEETAEIIKAVKKAAGLTYKFQSFARNLAAKSKVTGGKK